MRQRKKMSRTTRSTRLMIGKARSLQASGKAGSVPAQRPLRRPWLEQQIPRHAYVHRIGPHGIRQQDRTGLRRRTSSRRTARWIDRSQAPNNCTHSGPPIIRLKPDPSVVATATSPDVSFPSSRWARTTFLATGVPPTRIRHGMNQAVSHRRQPV